MRKFPPATMDVKIPARWRVYKVASKRSWSVVADREVESDGELSDRSVNQGSAFEGLVRAALAIPDDAMEGFGVGTGKVANLVAFD